MKISAEAITRDSVKERLALVVPLLLFAFGHLNRKTRKKVRRVSYAFEGTVLYVLYFSFSFIADYLIEDTRVLPKAEIFHIKLIVHTFQYLCWFLQTPIFHRLPTDATNEFSLRLRSAGACQKHDMLLNTAV